MRLQDIADRAGVSKATVSLALRNHASIPERTRARIHALAAELRYQPNPLVSALMTHRRATQPSQPTHLTLAMVINFSRDDLWRNYLSEDLLTAAAARAEQLGYKMEEFWLGDSKLTAQRLSAILFRRNVPGVIVAPLPTAHGHMNLEWEHFSGVAIGYSLLRPMVHRVTTNRFLAMRTAVRQLRRLGYRRLGLAMQENQDARVDHQWGAAFTWEQEQVAPPDRTVPFVVENSAWNEREFARWFQENRPDSVLSDDAQVIEWLARLGQRVPDDVGFVHLWNPDLTGTFAGLYHNPPAIGAAAVDFVVGMIQRNERGLPSIPQTLLMDAVWQPGATVRQVG